MHKTKPVNLIISSFILLFLLFFTACSYQSRNISADRLFLKDSIPRLISKQFSFTEGPAADKQGNIFFTDQPNNTIWKYSTDGKLSVFMENAGRSNGLYFDENGNLLACADENNQLWSISPKGKITVLVKDFEGKQLNGPNDVWVHPDGGIYFTDPYYQRFYWERKTPEIKEQRLYYLPNGQNKPIIAAEGFTRPNGLIGTADGKYLYTADIGAGKIYRFIISDDGLLQNRQLFADQGSDGMTIDEKGNIYLTGNGVTVYSPQGKKIAHISVPEKWTANVCFGGKRRNELFITASQAVYILPMQIKGLK